MVWRNCKHDRDRREATAAGGSNTHSIAIAVNAPVTTEAELNALIKGVDATTVAGTYTIQVAGPITLTTALEAINLHAGVTLDLEGSDGNGNAQMQTLDGGGDQRGLFIYSGVVNVTDLTLSDMRALGGSGASGGGGGAGLGGGLFVAGARPAGGVGAAHDPGQAVVPIVTLDNVNFSNDSATGGAGGTGRFGGGGGLGGNGGAGGDSRPRRRRDRQRWRRRQWQRQCRSSRYCGRCIRRR